MIDINFARDHPELLDHGLARRGLPPLSAEILALDSRRRSAQTSLQELQQRRNEISRQIGAEKSKGANVAAATAEVASIKDAMQAIEGTERQAAQALESLLAGIPCLPAADVPDGRDAGANLELRRHGQPPGFNFAARHHFEIGESLGMMDFETAADLSGARFVVLRGTLARLERALAAFMLDLHTNEFGYTEVVPPFLVRDKALFGTGQLPKFADDLFRTEAGLWLIPTAEVPLTNLVADHILDEADLPLRFTAYTPCFRSEAGAAGKDTRGMIRQHQFSKVELVSIAHPDRSADEHERMTACAEAVLQRLGIAYRVVVLCSGDMGFAAQKTYDIEVWLPGQGSYREISSCSNCGDFQARRMKARLRRAGEKGTRFVHTLNGSGMAIGRTLIAILENYQRADGNVLVPQVLRPYMGGIEIIQRHA